MMKFIDNLSNYTWKLGTFLGIEKLLHLPPDNNLNA